MFSGVALNKSLKSWGYSVKRKILSLVPRIPFLSINVELWYSVSLKVTLKKKPDEAGKTYHLSNSNSGERAISRMITRF